MVAGGWAAAATYLLGNRSQVIDVMTRLPVEARTRVRLTTSPGLWPACLVTDCVPDAAFWCRGNTITEERQFV